MIKLKLDKKSKAFLQYENFIIYNSTTMVAVQSDSSLEIANDNADALNRHSIKNCGIGPYRVVSRKEFTED